MFFQNSSLTKIARFFHALNCAQQLKTNLNQKMTETFIKTAQPKNIIQFKKKQKFSCY